MRILALVLVICAALVVPVAAQESVTATVYQTVNVRSGPDTRFEIVGQLAQGDTVEVIGQDASGRWFQVTLPTGEVGWLPLFVLTLEADLALIPIVDEDDPNGSREDVVTVVAYGRVNVRTAPAISGDVIGQLALGDEAEATARSSITNDWLLIENEEVEGWVAFFTVRVAGNLDELPVLVPDSSGEELIPPTVLIRTRFNARLHPTPELNSPTLVIVPFDSEVTPIARSDNGRWLLVGYEGRNGWGIRDLFDITGDEIVRIPIFVAQPTPSAVIPEATDTVEAGE